MSSENSCNNGLIIGAADAPKLPAISVYSIEQGERRTSFSEQRIAKKKELLFSDDFVGAEPGMDRERGADGQFQED